MGASDVSIFPDQTVVLVDSPFTRTYVNGAWEARGDIPASSTVIWIKPEESTPDPVTKARDVVVYATPKNVGFKRQFLFGGSN